MGQKQNTKTPTQPTLRFKGYTGDWEEKKLGEVAEGFDYGLGASAVKFDGINKYIRITDIDDESHRFIGSDLVSPDQLSNSTLNKYLVNYNDILLARTGASVGKSYLYSRKDGRLIFAGFLIRAHINDENCSQFVFQQTLTDRYNRWVKVTSMRTGQPGINAQEYQTYSFFLPSLLEQQKIGSFLSKIDERIELEEKKLELFKERKRGWMQKIFNQEIRFKDENGNDYPDWKEKKLGELFSLIRNGVNIRQFGNKGIPITRIESISKGYLNVNKLGYASIMDDSYEDYYLKEGDILFSHINSVKHIGKMAYIQKNFNIIHGMNLLLLRTINNNSHFLFYYLSNNKIKHQYTVLAKPAVNQASLSISELKNIDIVIPSLPEQQKIADFLSKQDELISAQEEKVSLLKEQKKGLLQQMFI